MTMQDVNSVLMGAGGRSASFKKHGDQVWGVVVGSDMRQQTDFDDGSLLFWDDGKPKMQIVISLLTDERDDDEDDGLRRVYVKVPSQFLKAMRDAITKTGAKGIEDGGKFLVRYMSDAEPTRRGKQGQKQYFCKYEPPTRATVLPSDGGPDYEDDVPPPDDDLPF